MNDELDRQFVGDVYEIVGRRDEDHDRHVDITPYQISGYGLGGVVITIAGSPPRSTVYVPLHTNMIICLWGAEPIVLDKDKVSTEKQYELIMHYLKTKGAI
jgi:hypothetical protein